MLHLGEKCAFVGFRSEIPEAFTVLALEIPRIIGDLWVDGSLSAHLLLDYSISSSPLSPQLSHRQ
jgi:hypothetical protein